MEEFTAAQVQDFTKFKEAIRDFVKPDHDDNYLCKWFKAREYDPGKAETMYRKSMAWRERVGADGFLSHWEKPEVLSKYFPGGPAGADKDGFPIWMELNTFGDFPGLMASAKIDDIVKYRAYQCEILRELERQQSKKLGRYIGQSTVIMDMEKMSVKHMKREYMTPKAAIMEMMEANYPETLRRCFIINAPSIFPILFNLSKPFMHKDTREKFFILGSDWKTALREYVDPDQLPVYWGGTMRGKDGNEYASPQINIGGDIPQSYYLKGRSRFSNTTIKFKEAIIIKGQSLRIQKEAKAGSTLLWEFQTAKYDIGFGVFLKTSDSQTKLSHMTELVPVFRANSQLVPHDGAILCKQAGTYVLVFDNSFSWYNSKEVSYFVDVIDEIKQPD